MDLYEPVLELSLQLSNLQLHGGFHEPSVVVAVEISNGSHGRWVHHSQTEAVHTRKDCSFVQTISFFPGDNIDPKTKLHFLLKRLRKNDQSEVIGSCVCVADVFISNFPKLTQLTLREKSRRDSWLKSLFAVPVVEAPRASGSNKKVLNSFPVGFMEIRLVNISSLFLTKCQPLVSTSAPEMSDLDEMSCLSRSYFFHHLLINPVNRSYRLLNACGDELSVYEYMLETPLSCSLPLQYLEMCRSETSRTIKFLEASIAHGEASLAPTAAERQRVGAMLSKCREHLVQYKARIDSMRKYFAGNVARIKKSSDKTSDDLEFVPINLHVQHMRVHRSRKTGSAAGKNRTMVEGADVERHSDEMNEYTFVTVGATAAHSKGFKQGGLLTIMGNYQQHSDPHNTASPSTSRNKKMVMGQDGLRRALEFGGMRERAASASLQQRVTQSCSKLHDLLADMSKLVISASSGERDKAQHARLFTILDTLSENMSKFVACCDQRELVKSLHSSNNHVPSPSNRPLLADDDMHLEDLKLKVKSSLASLVKLIHRSSSSQQCESSDHADADDDVSRSLLDAVKDCEECIKQLQVEAERAILHAQLLKPSSMQFYSDIFYRRRIVTAQALSLCACGVASTILKVTSERRADVLRQYETCGFLLQVESLLSTYGNESGMIQDYVIGILDLDRVSVKFEKKCGSISNNWSPVLLTGSTCNLVLKLFLDEESFELLPESFKNGGEMKIHPTFFNVGINQEQTLAEKFGDTHLQEYLNREGFQRLVHYHEKVTESSPQTVRNYPKRNARTLGSYHTNNTGNSQQTSSGFLPRMRTTLANQYQGGGAPGPLPNVEHKTTNEVLDKIRAHLLTNKSKPVEVVQLAAQVCRRLNGLRVTSCKSAKDRTAMSVTLEQANILLQEYNVDDKTFVASLAAMRSNGTRLENTMKNVGQRKYAFASVQLITFPKLYRPPDGTYGKVES